MRRSTVLSLGASVAFGVFAVIMAKSWINDAIRDEYSRHAKPATGFTADFNRAEVVPVVVATRNLNFGDRLSPEVLRVVEYPADAIPSGTYETMNQIFVDPAKPTVVLRRMAENEAVLDYKISGPGARGSLSALIGEGMRAVSVRVSDVTGVSGFVMPGDFVDVIYTRDEESRRNGNNLKSDVLLQNIRVLGIDQDLNEMTNVPSVVKTVTLEVSNQDAQKLHLAQDAGKISLTLRSAGDTMIEQTASVLQQSILANQQRSVVRPVAKRVASTPKPKSNTRSRLAEVTIFRGEERDQVQVLKDPTETLSENSDLAGG